MDAKEQIIYNLKREIQLLKLENEYLKDTIHRLNGGKPIQMPSTQQLEQQFRGIDLSPAGDGFMLPPIVGHHHSSTSQHHNPLSPPQLMHQQSYNTGPTQFEGQQFFGSPAHAQSPTMQGNAGQRMLGEFEFEIQRLREENS